MSLTVIVTAQTATPQVYPLSTAYGLRFTNVNPGGSGIASFYVPAEFGSVASIPNFLGFDFRVGIWDGGRCLWAGLMDPPQLEFNGGTGWRWVVTAQGWAVLLGARREATRNVQNTQTSVIVSNAMANLVPDITTLSITATGYTTTNTAAINLLHKNAAEQIAWAAQFGDSSLRKQVWYVYPDDNGTIRFSFGPIPSTPSYSMQIGHATQARLGGVRATYANRVHVDYNNGSSNLTVNDTTAQGAPPAGVGFVHDTRVSVSEITNSTDATQVGNTILTYRKALRLAPNGPITVPFDTQVVDANGLTVPPWRIRAGFQMRLTDVLVRESGTSNLSLYPQFLIAEVDVDENTQTVTVTPESFDTYIEGQLARMMTLLSGKQSVT